MVETEPSVAEIVAERVLAKRPWYARGDNFKVGLVIEGGAMRGVISGGMTLGVGALAAAEAFDGIYGVSAGACAGAYLLSKQTEAVTIYWEDINKNCFIDPNRLLIGRPIVDIPYLAYTVMKRIKPLMWRRVVESPTPLHVFTTSAVDGRAIDLHEFRSLGDILDALHWSCRLPVLAGMPIRVGYDYYTDGGVATGGLAINEALNDGCTHLLVLMSSNGGPAEPHSPLAAITGYLILKKEFPRLAAALASFDRRSRQIRQLVDNCGRIDGIKVSPEEAKKISLLERDRQKLAHGANEGYKAVLKHFAAAGLQAPG